MRIRICQLTAVILAVILLTAAAVASPVWPQNNEGQKQLAALVGQLNAYLSDAGEQPVNSLYATYRDGADFGINDQPDGEIPEGVEFHADLYPGSINKITLRVNDKGRFPVIAGSLLKAISPDQYSGTDAMAVPKEKAAVANKEPASSFEETVTDLNGTIIRTYYAYYPDQYHDGTDWMQLTVVFPIEGYEDTTWSVINDPQATKGPDTYSDHDAEYDGYFSEDDYTHFEVFVTPTPEPDSAAADGWSEVDGGK